MLRFQIHFRVYLKSRKYRLFLCFQRYLRKNSEFTVYFERTLAFESCKTRVRPSMGCRKIKETHCGRRRSSIKTDRQGNSIPPPVWYLIYYNIKANDNGRKLNFNTAPAAASIVRTYPVRPQRWRQCRRTALHAPCNKNILHAFCRFAGAAPHSGPGPVTDTQLPSLTTPACCNYAVNRRI